MGRIGGGELLLILLIALLIFGPSKLSEMGKGLGEGLKNFKKGISQGGDGETDANPSAAPSAAPEPPKALAPAPPDLAASREPGSTESGGTAGVVNATKTSES